MRECHRILVTGATGYIGGRLVPRLLQRGYEVRCLARHPEHVADRPWPKVEVVKADLLDPATLEKTLAGMEAAAYLVHSMAREGDFAARDATAARNFARAAKKAGLRRVIYLGGLGSAETGLSRHLASRQEVGRILREEGPPVTEFRAAVIVGAGSVSFEIIRYLVERLPVGLSPRCLATKCQPIAIRDVLNYMFAALDTPASAGRIIEIGGSSVLTYEEMLRVYSRIRGLDRHFLRMPCVNSKSCATCAKWISMLTPVPSELVLPLLESLRIEVVCKDKSALELFPIVPLDYATAVRYALRRMQEGAVETTWTMALFPRHRAVSRLTSKEGLSCDERELEVASPASRVFSTFTGIGGERGAFYMDWLWTLRGWLDRLVGGVGRRRGRRHKDILHQGEPLDFWRVERVIQDRLLLLRAEMRLPGRGWLQFESIPTGEKTSLVRQTAYFEAKGLFGTLYWLLLYPIHAAIFAGLIRAIKRRSEQAVSD